KIHDLSRLRCRPGGLDRFHDVEPVAVEEECVLAEQVVELWNQGMVVGNGPSFELAQSSLDLCGVKFHCTLLSVRAKAMRRVSRVAGPPTSGGRMRSSVSRGLGKLFPRRVK